jgi:3-oxoacyl-[acyl-carrier-protein] synthase III
MRDVYITRVSKFLPNRPVANEDMEDYLGMIDGKPSRARRIILRSNGITARYYALDQQGRTTHTNAQLTAEAVRALFSDGLGKTPFDLLACGTTTPDQLLPAHASMVQGLLAAPDLELASFTGACLTGTQALKYAYLAILAGTAQTAVCTGSERISRWMRSENFEHESQHVKQLEGNPIIAFQKEFLRWMLSDGAGAMLLEAAPGGSPSFKIEWIDTTSFADAQETCMYAGAEKDEQGNLKGWSEHDPAEWVRKSVFAVKQDTRLLEKNIIKLGCGFLKAVCRRRSLSVDTVDYFLPHISSHFFKEKLFAELENLGMAIPYSKWFTNLATVGNVGSASIYLMLEELAAGGKLQKGQRILLLIPESARFSYGYALLTVV